jgi:histidyl-tRNA synthetase
VAGGGIRAPRGTGDLFGEELEKLERLERLCANTAKLWGYSGIRTPIFEHTSLFTRSIGDATDIVEKEMFTIPRQTEKKEQDTFTLRPENTAGVVRAYLEHNLHKTQGLTKLHYVGPQFRREKPQKGRLREFNQMGVEVLGLKKGESGANYVAYAEVMLLAAEILSRAGLKGLQLRYNSVGCGSEGCRDSYRAGLKSELSSQQEKLCGDCQKRIDRNVFRVLDCKKPNCRGVCTETLRKVPQNFCRDCGKQMDFVKSTLDTLKPDGVQVVHDSFLVRGLDYYTGTVFEFTADGLGAQDAVGGGGSYDGLIEELGGPSLGATGFALGLERVLMAQEAAGALTVEALSRGDLVYVAPVNLKEDGQLTVPMGQEDKLPFHQAVKLRRADINTLFDLSSNIRSISKLVKRADKLGARLAVIIGPDEVKAGEATLKDMQSGEQRRVKQAELIQAIQQTLG